MNIEQTRKINKQTSNERTHIKKTISLLFMFYIIQLATLLPHNSNEPQMTCQAINPPNQSCHVPLATQRLEFLQPAKAIFRPDKMKQIDPKVTTPRPADGSELTPPAGRPSYLPSLHVTSGEINLDYVLCHPPALHSNTTINQ
jgi:hypothetical protein